VNGERVHAILSSFTDRGGEGVFMSRYLRPCFKRIRRLGALPGLTSKRPKAGKDLPIAVAGNKGSRGQV